MLKAKQIMIRILIKEKRKKMKKNEKNGKNMISHDLVWDIEMKNTIFPALHKT